MARVGVVGASGYTGGELLRILATHPNVEVTYVTSREYAGKPVSSVHPNLRGYYTNLKFSNVSLDEMLKRCDLIFINTPSKVSVNITPQLLESGMHVIDLSPDFRLKNPEEYRRWYGFEHPAPDLLQKAVYGLPELHRDEIRKAKLVASPGCNSTAALLSLIPAVAGGFVELDRIVVDVKVGSSEAGIKPSLGTHHPERANVMRPYEADGHRHVAEVEQELKNLLGGREVKIALVPHAVGSVRGALATSHVWLTRSITEQEVWRMYAQHYAGEPFIRIVRGSPFRYPDPKYVIGSNYTDVGFAVEERISRAALIAAIDNLMKGAAGQAVQSMNIMLGIDERIGLNTPPLRPA